jgi:hypothetical protein
MSSEVINRATNIAALLNIPDDMAANIQGKANTRMAKSACGK